MAKQDKISGNYQNLVDWYTHSVEQNIKTRQKLLELLANIDRDAQGDEAYEKDIDDLESLKLIYETGIRRAESQLDRYKKLLGSLGKK